MSEETAIVPVIEQPATYFVATNREEMAKAQMGLTAWVSAKIEAIKVEIQDVSKSLDIAKKSKWATLPLQRQKNLWYGRRVYYEKVLEALQAGFVIVPEFPIDMFAIRVGRTKPLPQENTRDWNRERVPEHPSDRLPAGEGEYKASVQTRYFDERKSKDSTGKEVTRYHFYNDMEFSDVAFPLIACKPDVMNAAQQAMAMKIFDSVGVCPQNRRTGDPLVIGVIEGPKVGYTQKKCHFLISWHIEVTDL